MCCTLATALLAVMAGSAVAAGLGPTTKVTVKPGSGTPKTHFALRFRIPAATGRFGSVQIADTLSVTGPGAGNCQSRATRALRPARKGARVTVTLKPAKRGWCAGKWRGTIVQSESERCTPTAGHVCPDIVVAPRVIASFRFRVKPAATHTPTQPTGDVPSFKGLVSAVTCPSGGPHPGAGPSANPGPVIGPDESGYTLTWAAATDPVTPSSQIVYEIFVATSPGAEDYAKPSYTTGPGATSFSTPAQVHSGTLYFVVRARNQAGREDANTVERAGVVSCPPLTTPQRQSARW